MNRVPCAAIPHHAATARRKPASCSRRRANATKPHTAGGPGTLHDPCWPAALERLPAGGRGRDLRVPFRHLGDAVSLLADAPNVDAALGHAGLPWDRSAAALARWRRGASGDLA
ncbi:hypothetical protein WS99_10140 [Burkholderia territorii]|nr:hypothetical protein WS99_10140 [Burkholderia territorii]KWA07965.1 hypothetical protein WT36_12640 [Burkholderia territorii]KWA23974.1 hypothetical protein WT39_23595 [Burkholderia territorii]